MITSALAACSSGPAKPDAYCGPGSAPATGIVATGSGFSLTYGNGSASANNDCPDPSAPMGVVALTIETTQTAGGPGFFTLCVQRPDQLAGGLALGTQVKLVDLTGSAAGCTFLPDRATAATGTVTATGECNNGTSPAGFAITVDGTAQLKRTCGATVDSVAVTVQGTIAVTGP